MSARTDPRSRPVSRADRKERTHARLIAAAGEEFAIRGFAATRTVDVARRAGVSHGTVFLHFPTREDLVTAVIDDLGTRVVRRMHRLVQEGMGVRDVLEAHVAGLREHEELYARLVAEAPVLPPDGREALLGIQSAMSFVLYGAAERAMNEGTLRRVPMHLLFNTWVALIHYYLSNRELFAPEGSVLARRGAELVDHYMTLLEGGGGER